MEVSQVLIESTVKFYFFVLPLLVNLIDKNRQDLQTYRTSSHKNLLEMNEFSLTAICRTFNQENRRLDDSAGKSMLVFVSFQLYFQS